MKPIVAIALVALVLAGAVGGAVGQPAPINVTNGTNGTNGTNSTSPVNVTNGSNTTNGSGGGDSGGGFGFGVPSTDEIVGDAVNGTVGTITGMFTRALGGVLMLPWQLIALRGAPFAAAADAASSPAGLFARPDAPVYGSLYDMATGSLFALAAILFALMFVLDWFGNLSPSSPLGAVDRLFLRAADMLHLLFSWPIAWGHFIIASAISLALLPDAETVGGSLETATSNILGMTLVGAALVFSVVGLLVAVYLVVKHAGAFIYLVVGLAAYPLLVAMSVPDGRILGSLGEYGERARARYPVAAWYPVPTAAVLGIGYAVGGEVVELGNLMQSQLPGSSPLGDSSIAILALYYPILWLAALYAPVKLFSGGEIGEKLKNVATAGAVGGAAGAATGSAAGASSGAAAGSAAGSTAGSTAAVGAGSTAAGALPEGRFSSGSPGAAKLARDGGTATVSGGGSSGTSFVGSQNGTADAITPSEGGVDLTQRYEPHIQTASGGLERVERPRNAEWLVDKGGVGRLDASTDDPLYFRGESDGELYDLRNASGDGPRNI